MKNKGISEIIELAKQYKICNEWYLKMKSNPSWENLCKMYFKGSDWSEERDFPPLEIVRKYKDEVRPFGLLSDEIHNDLLSSCYEIDDIKRIALFGNSDASISVGGYEVVQIIVRHNSRLKIKATENAIVMVDILDSANVDIEKLDKAKIIIYKK